MCREIAPEIGGGNWKGPPADSSEVVGWNNELIGGGCDRSLSQRVSHMCTCDLDLTFDRVFNDDLKIS